MKVSDFDYTLPEELIAQTPLKDRSSSRLLILEKDTGKISHDHFNSLDQFLNKGDNMTTIEDLPQKSISEMSTEEALELLRTIRLSRRTPKVSSKKRSKKQTVVPKKMTPEEARKLLEIIGGNK